MSLPESPSLCFDIERAEAPHGVVDPLDRRTWARMRIATGERTISNFWDSESERVSPYVFMPLFNMAEWILRNWWALLYEPFNGEESFIRFAKLDTLDQDWLFRHALRSSDSATYPPSLYLYSNGPRVSLVWREDREESKRERYLGSGRELLERSDVEAELRKFVSTVLNWCGGLENDRIEALKSNLEAVGSTSTVEYRFCAAAGTLGLDPYATSEWPGALFEFLAGDFSDDASEPLADDFLEAVEPENAPALWDWIRVAKDRFQLLSHQRVFPVEASLPTAKDFGYSLARRMRERVGMTDGGPVGNLVKLARDACGFQFRHEMYNHVPSQNVIAIVGWLDENTATIASPGKREESQRFLEARGLYQLLTGCASGARLLTTASTWQQQAGRAFAAELLAPMEALAAKVHSDMDFLEQGDIVQELADQYRVSTLLVQNQLRNYSDRY